HTSFSRDWSSDVCSSDLLKQQATEAQTVYGQMISYLDEALSGIKIIKAFNATGFVKQRFHDENSYYSSIGRKMARRQQLASPVRSEERRVGNVHSTAGMR